MAELEEEEPNKHFITLKYLTEIEEGELDLSRKQEICGKRVWDDGYEEIYLHKNKDRGWEGETERIKIELLEKVIAKMKKKGANYMEIMHHTDHNGYVFYGLDVRKSTDKEIEEYKDKIKRREEIESRMDVLKTEFNKLNDEWREL